jgi:hypothetical protein
MGPVTNIAIMIHDRAMVDNATSADPRIGGDDSAGGNKRASTQESRRSNGGRRMHDRLKDISDPLRLNCNFLPQTIASKCDMYEPASQCRITQQRGNNRKSQQYHAAVSRTIIGHDKQTMRLPTQQGVHDHLGMATCASYRQHWSNRLIIAVHSQ